VEADFTEQTLRGVTTLAPATPLFLAARRIGLLSASKRTDIKPFTVCRHARLKLFDPLISATPRNIERQMALPAGASSRLNYFHDWRTTNEPASGGFNRSDLDSVQKLS
jgi:hypothetical protein